MPIILIGLIVLVLYISNQSSRPVVSQPESPVAAFQEPRVGVNGVLAVGPHVPYDASKTISPIKALAWGGGAPRLGPMRIDTSMAREMWDVLVDSYGKKAVIAEIGPRP